MATRIALLFLALFASILCNANGFIAPLYGSQRQHPHGSKDQSHNKKDQKHYKHCLSSPVLSPTSLSLSLCVRPIEVVKNKIRKTKHSLQKRLFPQNNRRMILGAAILLSMLALNQPVLVKAAGTVASGGSQGSVVQMDRYVLLFELPQTI